LWNTGNYTVDTNKNGTQADVYFFVSKGNVDQYSDYQGEVVSSDTSQTTSLSERGNRKQLLEWVSLGAHFKKGTKFFKNSNTKAEFNGIIQNVTIADSQIELDLINMDALFVRLDIPQGKYQYFPIGKTVLLKTSGGNYKALISFRSNIVEDGTLEVNISYQDPKMLLLPGATVTVQCLEVSKTDVLRIPSEYVSQNVTTEKFINNDSEIELTIGLRGNDFIEVSGDIKEGDSLGVFSEQLSAGNASTEASATPDGAN